MVGLSFKLEILTSLSSPVHESIHQLLRTRQSCPALVQELPEWLVHAEIGRVARLRARGCGSTRVSPEPAEVLRSPRKTNCKALQARAQVEKKILENKMRPCCYYTLPL